MLPLTQLHVETIDPLIGIIFFIVSVFLWKLQVPGESISLKCSHLQVTITDQGRWAFVGTHNCWNAVFDWKTASGALTKTKQSQNTTLPLLCDFFYHAFIYAFTWFYFYLNKKNLNTFRFGLWKCPTAIPGPAYVMAVIVNRGGAGWLYWAAVWRTVWVGILYARLTADQTEHNIVSWSVLVQAKLIFFSFFPSPEIFCHSDCICLQTCQTQWAAQANRIWQNPPGCWAQAVAWWPEARSTWTSSDRSLVVARRIIWHSNYDC